MNGYRGFLIGCVGAVWLFAAAGVGYLCIRHPPPKRQPTLSVAENAGLWWEESPSVKWVLDSVHAKGAATAMLLAMFAMVALPAGGVLLEGRRRWRMMIALAMASMTTITALVFVWAPVERTMALGMLAMGWLLGVPAVTLVLAAMLDANPCPARFRFLRPVAEIGLHFTAFGLFVATAEAQVFWFGLAAGAALATAATYISLPLLDAVERAGRTAVLDAGARSLAVTCPRCETAQTVPVGRSRCGKCRMRFDFTVEEPRCPSCRYLLHRLTQPRCPECGRDLPADEIAAPDRTD